MSDVSVLTERDRALVDAGRMPIDIDPPRPMTKTEIREQKLAKWLDLSVWEPVVHRGYIAWRRRGQ